VSGDILRRAQIRIGETIAVLLIFFFLLVLGVTFYLNIQKSRVYSNIDEVITQESIRISQMVSYLAELQCSSENIIEPNCYDLYKLDSADDILLSNSDYYYPLFLFSEIVIDELYPYVDSWVLYNNTYPASAPIYTYIPISLYNPVSKRYSFGVLSVLLLL
jgi:hypothetical protein